MNLFKITTKDEVGGLHKAYHVYANGQLDAEIWFASHFGPTGVDPVEAVEAIESEEPMALLQML